MRGWGAPQSSPQPQWWGQGRKRPPLRTPGSVLSKEETHRLPPSHQLACSSCPLSPHGVGGTAPPRLQAALDGGTWPTADPGPPAPGGHLVPADAVCPSCSPTVQGAGPSPFASSLPFPVHPASACPASLPTPLSSSRQHTKYQVLCSAAASVTSPEWSQSGGWGCPQSLKFPRSTFQSLSSLFYSEGEKKESKVIAQGNVGCGHL